MHHAKLRKLRLPRHGSTDAPSAALADLLHEWDAKLRDSGLDDVEFRNPNGTMSHHIRENSTDHVLSHDEPKAEYYRLAGAWTYNRPDPWPNRRLVVLQTRLGVLERELDRIRRMRIAPYRRAVQRLKEPASLSQVRRIVEQLADRAVWAAKFAQTPQSVALRKRETRLANQVKRQRRAIVECQGLEPDAQRVWRLHADGLTEQEIRGATGFSMEYIGTTIRAERALMLGPSDPATLLAGDDAILADNHVLERGGRTPVRDSGYDGKFLDDD